MEILALFRYRVANNLLLGRIALGEKRRQNFAKSFFAFLFTSIEILFRGESTLTVRENRYGLHEEEWNENEQIHREYLSGKK